MGKAIKNLPPMHIFKPFSLMVLLNLLNRSIYNLEFTSNCFPKIFGRFIDLLGVKFKRQMMHGR